jgi:hypothetical protein
MRYLCCDRFRRNAVDRHARLNGIDWIEVGDLVRAELDAAEQAEHDARPASRRGPLLWQCRLTVHFINPLTAEHIAGLGAGNVRISGGERVRDPAATLLAVGVDEIVVRAADSGDFSRYVLAIVRSAIDPRPPAGFDPILSAIEFSFKVDCPSEFDCRTEAVCPPTPDEAPEIDYLAKDYESFRRLILDRITRQVPGWRTRNAADVGVTLVELLAYAGDHLSYQQDAVGTEAYLDTARRRVSVRRHALLVDYFMHDGCNARAWAQLLVNADAVIAPDAVRFCTRVGDLADRRIAPGSRVEARAVDAGALFFEPVVPSLDPAAPLAPIALFRDHERFFFHTWGDERCCLPRGATAAVLRGHWPTLAAGMVLVLEERVGPLTGLAADADPRHRHAVRLTSVVHTEGGQPLTDPLNDARITRIAWGAADALPFPLCISSVAEEGGAAIPDVSVALGNIVLVDHGRRVTENTTHDAATWRVPAPRLHLAHDADTGGCARPTPEPVPPRFRPRLAQAPLTRTGTMVRTVASVAGLVRERVRFDPDAPASAAFAYAVADARAALRLEGRFDGIPTNWFPVRDLLDSDESEPAFVVESEHDGVTELRFGDDEHGRRPETDTSFAAAYRTGNGAAGNIGADALWHVVTADGRIDGVRNPLPAAGGREPESAADVRRRAPQAFRTQDRAVTPADYEAVVLRMPGVQRAAATLRDTGTWKTVFLTVDRVGGLPIDAPFEAAVVRHVDRYRMAGYDLEVDGPRYVSLEIELFVCVAPEHFRAHVKARLLEVLSARTLPDGRLGLFHPDRFSFGQTIYLSPILAAARDVAGVSSVSVVKFQRQGTDTARYVDDGRMPLDRLEIARLDNDPNFPERGVLRLRLGGGK